MEFRYFYLSKTTTCTCGLMLGHLPYTESVSGGPVLTPTSHAPDSAWHSHRQQRSEGGRERGRNGGRKESVTWFKRFFFLKQELRLQFNQVNTISLLNPVIKTQLFTVLTFAACSNLRPLLCAVPSVCASGPVTTEPFPAISLCLSHWSVESVKAATDCCLTDAFDDDRKKG